MIKEIKFRPTCSDEDYKSKLDHAIRFLTAIEQVKLTVMFRGRELAHPVKGENLLKRLVEDLKNYGTANWPPVLDGRQMPLLITPKMSN